MMKMNVTTKLNSTDKKCYQETLKIISKKSLDRIVYDVEQIGIASFHTVLSHPFLFAEEKEILVKIFKIRNSTLGYNYKLAVMFNDAKQMMEIKTDSVYEALEAFTRDILCLNINHSPILGKWEFYKVV